MDEKLNSALPPRVGHLKSGMGEQGIDVVISFKPENSFYLSGFNPIIYSKPIIAIITRNHDPILLVHALRDEHARDSSWVQDIRFFGVWGTRETLAPTWQEALVSVLATLGLAGQTIGIEEGFITIQRSRELQQILPDAKFIDSSSLIERCRMVKDPDEIENSRIACKIADVGMEAAIAALARGGTERDATVASMHEMNKFWAETYKDVEVCGFGSLEGGLHNGLSTWVLAGQHKFHSCDNPTTYKPQPGDTVAVYIWTVANGMHAEVERIVCIGQVADVDKKAIEAILKIRAEIDPLIKPGTPIKELYNATRKCFETHGYGADMPGRIGHSIGLGAHEALSIGGSSEVVLEPGMIITIEPNIEIVGVCATQISDTVLITETGREYLTCASPGYLQV
ncbi:Xaa-Pro aminopeptidase [Arthroderma uncinatum]|uniref:Xaa-Pro aminopeptidase n=1 Tax=Arthroderma uncinatum TaxID=74035 RepID=UPI00144AD9B7|nr:Xaa-Pro aminopeptidase [Arthroderma uncinatum]KAF3481809.1 Xaa-Pro aminopeptidase [Arthroderma uncinatum]